MKIAVVGCGAVGSYYGAKLATLNEEVHFLLRSDYEAVRRRGVLVRSPQGDFRAFPRCAQSPQEIGICDLVLIGLKTTANEQFKGLLPPLVGPNTAILTLQNGLGNEEQLATLFSEAQILGGLCFVCLNRLEPGLIQHQDHGQIVLGEWRRWPEPRTHSLASLFRRAGVPCKVSADLERAHWEKLVWNIPFNGLGVAAAAGYEALVNAAVPVLRSGPCRPTDALLKEPCWEALVRELMNEVIRVAQALNLKVESRLADKQIARTQTMGAYKASTLIDFERGQSLELESLFLNPLRNAREVGVQVPRLQALCRVLGALDPGAGRVHESATPKSG
jgi:2-dehydropantoate 2-reductase